MSQTHDRAERESPPSTPRWVKVLGVITIVLILLVGIMLLTGEHGPGRHMPPVEHSTQQP